MKKLMMAIMSVALIGGALATTAAAQGHYRGAPYGRNRTALPTVVGAAAGAVVGAAVGGKKGAVIGGVVGAAGGYAYGRRSRGRRYAQPSYGYGQPNYGYSRPYYGAGVNYGGHNTPAYAYPRRGGHAGYPYDRGAAGHGGYRPARSH